MADGKKKDDKLALLRIERETVLVGELELGLKTSTLAQQKKLVEAIGKLDLETLFNAAKPIFASADGGDFFASIAEHGNELWTKVVSFIGAVGTDLLGELVATLLDNFDNAQIVAKMEGSNVIAPQGNPRKYVGSPELRDWIEAEVTFPQARYVFETAIRMNGHADLGKALLRVFFVATGKEEPQPKVIVRTQRIEVPVPTDLSHLTGPGPSTPVPEPSPSTPDEKSTPSDLPDPNEPIIA